MMTLPPDAFAVDLSAWAETQARALREGRIDHLDRRNLSVVIGRLALRERHDLRANLTVILTGLLRWAEQVDLRCHGWAASLDGQRHRVDQILRHNPSLQVEIPGLIAKIYPVAKARAVLESGLFDDSFAGACPFSEDEILTPRSYPDPYGDDAIRGPCWWSRGGSP